MKEQAFPLVEPTVSDCSVNTVMTLRDYFAAMAMQGQLAGLAWDITRESHKSTIPEASYRMADAMLAEREKGHVSD